MKPLLLLFSAALLTFTACKKEEPEPFKATDVTGTTVVKGNITKNIITPNGNGGWLSTGRIPAQSVNVSVKVNKNSLYPNSSAQGADVYSAVTDDKGNFSITVKTNAAGVAAQVTVDGFSGTLDTLINGNFKTGLLSTYSGISFNTTLVMGQNFTYNYAFTASNSQTNPNNIVIGNAVITGSVGLSLIKEIQTGTLVSLTTAYVPLTNYKVYLSLDKDPTTQTTRQYEVNTDGNGRFSFNLETVKQGTNGFPQNVTLWVNDLAATRDTVKLDNSVKVGRPGVFGKQSINLNGAYSTEILNGNYLQYTTFTLD
jgi:hypothetical protein